MLAIISFAREGSTRLPKKNTMILNGKPLIQYTIDCMKYLDRFFWGLLKNVIKCDFYILTDYKECQEIAEKNNIKVIWRDHPKEWDDTRLNKWVHEKINADHYVLLQPSNPLRDYQSIAKWIYDCIELGIKSAFSVYKKDRLNYIMNGNYFFYHKSMLEEDDLINDRSILFQDKYFCDIDTKEDFEKAKILLKDK